MSAADRAHRALAGEFLVRLGSDMALAGGSVPRGDLAPRYPRRNRRPPP